MQTTEIHRFIGIVASCLTLMLVAGCGGEETFDSRWNFAPSGGATAPDVGPQPDGSMDGVETEEPELELPQQLEFSRTQVGETSTLEFDITNRGDSAVRIDSMSVHEQADDGVTEIAPGDQWSSSYELSAGTTRTFSLRYQPETVGEDTADLRLSARGYDYAIPVSGTTTAPSLQHPGSIRFGEVPSQTVTASSFQLRNNGDAPLRLDRIELVESPEAFSLKFYDPSEVARAPTQPPSTSETWPSNSVPDSLSPGEAIGVQVWLQTDNVAPLDGTLEIESNDPNKALVELPISANVRTPCLSVSPETFVDFNRVPTGDKATATVQLASCGNSSVTIQDIALSETDGQTFSLDPDFASSLPAELDANETASVAIEYAPSDVGNHTARLDIESTDPDESRSPYSLFITGRGVSSQDHTCPTAEATGFVQDSMSAPSAQLQSDLAATVRLDGSASSDPDGTVDRYEWSVVSRPAGSRATFVPSRSDATPSFTVDMPGTFAIELLVFDDEGNRSCGERALVTVEVIPEGDIRAHLMWDTPADPGPPDTDGTDVDLYYKDLSQGVDRWKNSFYVISHTNPTADWGVPRDSSDDPILERDDRNGAGPETMRHDNPPGNRAYGLAVHYFASNNFPGPVFATLRLYSDGQLVHKTGPQILRREKAFWRAFEVTWPGLVITPIDELEVGIP